MVVMTVAILVSYLVIPLGHEKVALKVDLWVVQTVDYLVYWLVDLTVKTMVVPLVGPMVLHLESSLAAPSVFQ